MKDAGNNHKDKEGAKESIRWRDRNSDPLWDQDHNIVMDGGFKVVKRYCIISKGLSVSSARKLGIGKYAYKGKLFKTKKDAEKFFDKLPYKNQRNQKVVRAI